MAIKEPSKLQRQLAVQIQRHIFDERLAVGERLTELGLAEHFHVSRTPVRAALEHLASQGIVAGSDRGGYVVADGAHAATVELANDGDEEEELYLRIADDYMSRRLSDHFSEADLMRRYSVHRGLLVRVLQRMAREMVIERSQGHGWSFAAQLNTPEAHHSSYRFRLVVEPAGVLEPGYELDIRAAERCRAEHEQVMETPLEKLSPVRFFEVNAGFHELVAAGSRNPFFLNAMQQQNRLRRFLGYDWSYGHDRIIESCKEHMEILDALERREFDWAATILKRHIDLASRVDQVYLSAS